MDNLTEYLNQIVDPTFADFQQNPASGRYAYLACVTTFHAIDRVARKPGNLRKRWRNLSVEFLIVDMVAHHFKHVQSDFEKSPAPKDAIPLVNLVFRHGNVGSEAMGLDLRNLNFVVRDAIRFIRSQVVAQKNS